MKKADFLQYNGTAKVQLLQTILKCFVHKVAQPFRPLVAFRRQLLALAYGSLKCIYFDTTTDYA